MSSKPRVRVELAPMNNHVWVDDVDIRNIVTAVWVEFNPSNGPVPKVSLDLVPNEVKVDGELVEAIQPVLRTQPPQPGKATAYRHVAEDGKQWDLVYDPADVESFETPHNVIDVTEPDDKGHRRELGQAHLHLTFKNGKRSRWVPAPDGAVTP